MQLNNVQNDSFFSLKRLFFFFFEVVLKKLLSDVPQMSVTAVTVLKRHRRTYSFFLCSEENRVYS